MQDCVTNSPESYPTKEQCLQAWEDLAKNIVSADYALLDEPSLRENGRDRQGSLLVIGSGIESVGFTRDAEAAIKAADKVFFCVADPPTIVWIRKLRPDAYDLYVLYDDTKKRYNTYMQMTEAMLHPVRQGQSVVAIFYGHPGIFVLSTHRAIKIARREGYRARMQAGISALDCLCADLGVDPAHPGMVTYEATDMLVRQRNPDTSLHVVLWQVGLIGQMGYRRRGFVNDRFGILLEYLQSFYGEDYEVVHYIASRYPTIEPTIEVYKLSELFDPANQYRITGLSTFYIAPKDARDTDIDMAVRLGLARPGQIPGPAAAVREIARYGDRELKAIAEFEKFTVPSDFQHQPLTRISEFLIELTENPTLYQLYLRDPEAAVSEEVFPGLSEREKKALISRNEGSIQISCKGSTASSSPHDAFILALLRSSKLSRDLYLTIKSGLREDDLPEAFGEWVEAQGFQVRPASIPATIRAVNAMSLLPWTGAYLDRDTETIVAVMAHPNTRASLVVCNGVRISPITYYNGALVWRAEDGNPHSGLLRFDSRSLQYGPRILTGTISTPDAPEKTSFSGRDLETLNFSKPDPDRIELFLGSYQTQGLDWATCDVNSLEFGVDRLVIGEMAIDRFDFSNGTLSWQGADEPFWGGRLQFLLDPFTGMRFFFGTAGSAEEVAGKTNIYGYADPPEDESILCRKLSEESLSEVVWQSLQQLSQAAIEERGTPFWHEWQKMRSTTQIVNRSLLGIVRKLCQGNQ